MNHELEKRISAREVLLDIRAGMDRGGLKEKYGITDAGLDFILYKLSSVGVLTNDERSRLDAESHEAPPDGEPSGAGNPAADAPEPPGPTFWSFGPRRLPDRFVPIIFVIAALLAFIGLVAVIMGWRSTPVQPPSPTSGPVGDPAHPGRLVSPQRKAKLLIIAGRKGDLPKVRRLLGDGAQPDARGIDGSVALVAAAEAGHFQVVKTLLDNGANPNEQDEDGWTGLIACASGPGRPRIAELLLARGADPAKGANDGWTPAMWAAYKGHLDLVKLLADRTDGKAVTAAAPDGWTPLLAATVGGHEDVFRWLIRRGAEVNAATADGDTPLLIAVRGNKPALVSAALESGADASARDRKGRTPLEMAARNRDPEIMDLLIAHQADVNKKNPQDGSTVLMVAASEGYIDVVELLIDAGADVTARDNNGQTALDLAMQGDHSEVAELLKERGNGQ